MIRAEYFMGGAEVALPANLIRKPEVSVILPTYCRGGNGLLQRAIESVLSQTFSSFELLVMDDGSTDGTADIVSAYTRCDDRVIHVRHSQNCGLPALRVNEGLLMARAAICAYQFDDDEWISSFLSTMTSELRQDSLAEVAYGLCRLNVDGADQILGGPFNYSQLVAGNFISNNSLIHRKSVFERLGGYDMHLVMRRLCDWDLWMRWARGANFRAVNEIVCTVEGGKAESIGRTVAADSFSARAHMALDRNSLLLPGTLASYVVDELDHLRHLGDRKLDAVWRQQVAPYQSRFRRIWPGVRRPADRPLHVLVVKAHFDTTIDITIRNFAESLAGDFAFTFLPQLQTDETAIQCADILLMHRTIDDHALQLEAIARRHGKTVIFLMDDDLTTLHELGAEFSYLAPGAPCRIAMESLIRGADLVVTYSPLMQESVRHLNPRHVLLDTNILRKWLANAKDRLEQPSIDGRPIRIAFAGGGARREEIAMLWPAIVHASRSLGPRAEFHFWGFTPEGLSELQSPCYCEAFTFSYDQYLARLTSAGFDVMIAPLFAEKRAKRAKCPIKFLEITAAGAVGLYSNVEPYNAVAEGISGLKCENTVEAWTSAILQAAALTPSERKQILMRAIEKIEADYASEGQAARVAATLEAAVLHRLLPRAERGKPRIAYFCHSPYLAGAENHLLRHAILAQAFQFEPLLALPTIASTMIDEMQRRATALGIEVAYLPLTVETEVDASRPLDEPAILEIQHWLRQNRIALVHSVTLMREVGEAARRLGIPHAASLYATGTQTPAAISHCDVVHSDSLCYANRWGDVLNAPAHRILSYVPEAYFAVGESTRHAGRAQQDGTTLTVGLFGTLQPRKGQLQAVEAVGMLSRQSNARIELRLYGYHHFFPDYLAACKQMADQYGISNLVTFPGFVADTASEMRDVDVVLCASDWESLPQSILEAMAAGRLVIAPNVGGIAEVVSAQTGILMNGNSAASICRALMEALELSEDAWRARIDLSRKVVDAECSRDSVATELFRLYRHAAAECAARSTGTERSIKAESRLSPRPAVEPVSPDEAEQLGESLERLRARLHQINATLRVGR
jgi:O-antigen biosynthesis protein